MQFYLKNMIDSMPSVLIGVDRNGKVTQWNVEAEKKSGITPEKAMGKKIEDVFPQFASQLEKFKTIHSRKRTTENGKDSRKSG